MLNDDISLSLSLSVTSGTKKRIINSNTMNAIAWWKQQHWILSTFHYGTAACMSMFMQIYK